MAVTLVTGATGAIGGRLVPELLDAGHRVRCLVRNPGKLTDAAWSDRVEVVEGDITDPEALDRAMAGVEVAYYLVHSMGGARAFDETDRRAAASFRDAATRAGVGHVVYLGGLGRDDDPELSRHLRSRHEVGRVGALQLVAGVARVPHDQQGGIVAPAALGYQSGDGRPAVLLGGRPRQCGAEPVVALVQQFAATFDQAVGEEGEQRAGVQFDGAPVAASSVGHAERDIDMDLDPCWR